MSKKKKNKGVHIDNFKYSEADKETAKNAIENGGYVARYVRKRNCEAFLHVGKIKNNRYDAQIQIVKGTPIGALIAIKTDDGVKVGWSKRHVSKETLIFTKKNALYVAALRALTDGISIGNMTSDNGKPLPREVSKQMPSFLNRVETYFKNQTVNNIY